MKLKSKHGKSSIDDLENYTNQGTIIRSKEMIIINQEIPNKYFNQKEQQKEAKNKPNNWMSKILSNITQKTKKLWVHSKWVTK